MDRKSLNALPLKNLHVRLGARFGAFAGWEMPLWYGGMLEEVRAVRQAVGVFDISHMGRFEITGDDASTALSGVQSRNLSRLPVHRSIYALACNEGGGILDDLMVYRLTDARFLVVCNAANMPTILDILLSAVGPDNLRDLRDAVLFAVQGPEAISLIARILTPETLELPARMCVEVEVRGASYFIARTGYTGEDGVEIMTTEDAGRNLFQVLVAGGAVPCGLAARDTLRLEASLPLHGVDIDESTTPWEAGLGWALNLEHEFIGREALELLRGSQDRRLSCVVADGPGIMRSHQPVFRRDVLVSETSSGGFSPTLGRSIAMAYLPQELTEAGTELEIDARGRRIASHVIRRPFFRSPSRSWERPKEGPFA
jgi:aminomethyltransferase